MDPILRKQAGLEGSSNQTMSRGAKLPGVTSKETSVPVTSSWDNRDSSPVNNRRSLADNSRSLADNSKPGLKIRIETASRFSRSSNPTGTGSRHSRESNHKSAHVQVPRRKKENARATRQTSIMKAKSISLSARSMAFPSTPMASFYRNIIT